MIAVLDPAWLVRTLPRDEEALAKDIGALLSLCRELKAELSAVDDYWAPLSSELLRPLEQSARVPELRASLQALRGAARRRNVPPFLNQGRVRGFKQMFDVPSLLAPIWVDRMARAVLRLCQMDQPVVLLARPVVGRNVYRHGTGNLVLDEVTRWRLYAQPDSPTFIPIPCVRMARQVRLPWTARFDPRLPSASDGARYPFCPPEAWDDDTLPIVATRESKPAFIDRRDNGWTRPNIPGGRGYHWDVFIRDVPTIEAVGVDQLNIVEAGVPASEGLAGYLHHIPTRKAGRVHDIGWSCPETT